MHILHLPRSTKITSSVQLDAGEYLVEDHNAASIMMMCPGSIMKWFGYGQQGIDLGTNARFNYFGTSDSFGKINPKNILLVAPLGFGDAILLTPCLRKIKQLHPTADLHIATLPEQRQIFLGLPYVDGFEDYPLPIHRLQKFDCVLFLEHALDPALNPKAKTLHMTDLFAEHLGLPELEDKQADYRVSSDESEWVHASFPRTGKRRIGIQVQAQAHCRTYPAAMLRLVISALVQDKWEVYLLGRPGEFIAEDVPGLINLSRRGLTFRQSAAFLTTCDAFFGPDSSLLHVAGALNVPAVGVFGAYPWKLRTAYYKSVYAIQGTEGCTVHPCFHAQRSGERLFPEGQPCATANYCCALASILPKRIVAKIEQIAKTTTASEISS